MHMKIHEELGLSYSALASSTAALLAVLAASVTAYAVFLQERKAQFDDRISQDKIAIHDSVAQIEQRWNTSLFLMQLPPEFGQQYQAKYPDKRGADLFSQALFDVLTDNNSGMRDVLSRIPGAPKGRVQGRFYMWLATQAVVALTVSGPPGRPRVQGIFPAASTGPGFDRWRKDFERMSGTIQGLSFFRNFALSDFGKSLANQHPTDQREYLFRRQVMLSANDGLNTLFSRADSIKNSLKDIDNETALAERYSISVRLHIKAILGLFAIALVCGTILPILLLSLGRYGNRTLALLIATIALGSALGGSTWFGYDVISHYEGSGEYVRARWYLPLLEQIKANAPKLSTGGAVDLDLFVDAQDSADKTQFPTDLLRAIQGYVAAGQRYNATADAINAEVIPRLKNLLGAENRTRSGGSQVVTPLEVLSSERIEKLFAQNPPVAISFEVQGPWWSRVIATIPAAELLRKEQQLKSSLMAIGQQASHSPEFVRFTNARDEFVAAEGQLKEILQVLQPQIEHATP